MMPLFGLEIMPFEIAEVIITITFFPGEKVHKEFIPEMIGNIFFRSAALSKRIQGIADLKFLCSKVTGNQCRIGYTAASIAPYINDKMADVVFFQGFK